MIICKDMYRDDENNTTMTVTYTDGDALTFTIDDHNQQQKVVIDMFCAEGLSAKIREWVMDMSSGIEGRRNEWKTQKSF